MQLHQIWPINTVKFLRELSHSYVNLRLLLWDPHQPQTILFIYNLMICPPPKKEIHSIEQVFAFIITISLEGLRQNLHIEVYIVKIWSIGLIFHRYKFDPKLTKLITGFEHHTTSYVEPRKKIHSLNNMRESPLMRFTFAPIIMLWESCWKCQRLWSRLFHVHTLSKFVSHLLQPQDGKRAGRLQE